MPPRGRAGSRRGGWESAEMLTALRNFEVHLGEYRQHSADAVNETLRYEGNEMMIWLKTNAPWTDRTTAARSGLFARPAVLADPGRDQQWVTLEMGYSVEYGKWLEIANHGRYAIVTPALRLRSRRIYRTLRQVMS